MSRILVVDDDISRIKRFEAIFRDHPVVRYANVEYDPEERVTPRTAGQPTMLPSGIVEWRWVANDIQPHIVDIAQGFHKATDLMLAHTYDLVCLDHDLGSLERDGRTLARWIAGERFSNPFATTWKYIPGWRCPVRKVLIHSRNPIAAKEMANILLDMPHPPRVKLLPYQPAPGV